MSLENLRDIVVIVYGVMGIVLMIALCIAAFGLWFAVRALSSAVQDLLRENAEAWRDGGGAFYPAESPPPPSEDGEEA